MSELKIKDRLELHGVGASDGVGFGSAKVMALAPLQLPQYSIESGQIKSELKRFEKARRAVDKEIQEMISRTPKAAPAEQKSFLEMFRQLVNDPTLYTNLETIISRDLINVEWALARHLEEIKKVFETLSDSYLAERGSDIEHVVEKLQEELMGKRGRLREEVVAEPDEVVLVTSDLSLPDVIWLTEYEELDLVGIITERGGATSHASVLAQTLFIPAVVGVAGARTQIQNGDKVFIDSREGRIICNPSEEEEKQILERVAQQEEKYSRYYRARRRVAETTDGFRLQLNANIAMCSGLTDVLQQGAQGVGLFRSEYLFMGRPELPDEEEQYANYVQLAEAMGSKPVTIRTLDVGGDKILTPEALKKTAAYKDYGEEENPALGLRAIRFSLSNPDLFLTQIRAILRAAAGRNFRILLPLISTPDEIREAKKYIEAAKEQLRERNQKFNDRVPVGIMAEVPAVAVCPAPFLEEADFVSIGTNDLIQYTLAADRGNTAVAPLYQACHPAVLALIANVAKTAEKLKKPVCVCGEMGGERYIAPFFIGLGIRELSMAAMQIPQVKEVIRSVSKKECDALTRRVLKAQDASAAEAMLKKFVSSVIS